MAKSGRGDVSLISAHRRRGPRRCYYLIDESRGNAALQKFFIEAFDGTLVSDFWAAYHSVCCGDNQRCLPHLLRELIIRKNSLCNRSEQGAQTQAILMSLYRTLKLRGLDATKTIAEALKIFLQSGTLPPLPVDGVADG